MPIQYLINRSAGIIEEQWDGVVTIDDLREYWRRYLSDADVLSLRRTLVDLRAATMEFTGQELNDLVQSYVVPRLKGLSWKSAIVVAAPVQYGISRQYQVFANFYSKDSIFYDYAEARDWLLKH